MIFDTFGIVDINVVRREAGAIILFMNRIDIESYEFKEIQTTNIDISYAFCICIIFNKNISR